MAVMIRDTTVRRAEWSSDAHVPVGHTIVRRRLQEASPDSIKSSRRRAAMTELDAYIPRWHLSGKATVHW